MDRAEPHTRGPRSIVRRAQRQALAFALALLGAFGARAAHAQEDSPSSSPFGMEIHGFVSQGFIYTTQNQFLAESERGSFEFSEIGLNFTKTLTPELRVGVQLFAQDLGPVGDYKPRIDWYYLDYRLTDWLGVRAGRTKVAGGLYNDTSDIDAARAPILLPQSIYPVENRDILLAQTGAEAYGYLRLGALGAIDYRLFGGTVFYEPPEPEPNVDYTIPYTFGGRAQWFTPLDGLSAAISGIWLRVDQEVTVDPAEAAALKMLGLLSPDNDGRLNTEIPIRAWTASLEYAAQDLLLAFEYSRTHTDFWISDPLINLALFPPTGKPPYPQRGRNYYAMASYRMSSWFTPGVYYSVSQPNVERKGRNDSYRRDLALFVRYDLNDNWLLKLEGHYMNGTAGLNPRLNDLANADELQTLTREWGAFLIKTTAYF